jgi:chemotaxis signal transduction protein
MAERDEATLPETMHQYLSFTVAGIEYGVPILKVKEILQYEVPTRVPGTPPSIRGVVNVRGAAVPIVDLGVKFGNGEVPPTKLTCVLVVEVRADAAHLVLGVLADAVNEVVDLRPEDVDEPPTFGAGIRVDYLVGVGKAGTRFILLVDIDRVLTASEATVATEKEAVGGNEPEASFGTDAATPMPQAAAR